MSEAADATRVGVRRAGRGGDMSARAYVWLVLALSFGPLLPAAALNLWLAYGNVRYDKNALASAWQQRTRGVTYAPPISYNRPFKTLRLNDRLPEIDALVFGSSTAMGVRENHFPPHYRLYNFAQSGNPLPSVIGEAEYVVEAWGDRIRLLVIPLDWALGFIYAAGPPVAADLSRAAVARQRAAGGFDWAAQAKDALSLPRLKELVAALRGALRAPEPVAALRRLLLEPGGEDYACPDGTPARDFDTLFRGLCVGFRHDGSATFADQKRIEPRQAPAVLAAAAASASQYAQALKSRAGEPDAALLARLEALAARVAAGGGRVLYFLPPLLPGLERELMRAPHSAAALARTKSALEAWARAARVAVIDAGASERYGCTAAEFIDAHHALPSCYEKLFARFWRDEGAGTATAGGYRVQ
jgi:hypothetical protein